MHSADSQHALQKDRSMPAETSPRVDVAKPKSGASAAVAASSFLAFLLKVVIDTDTATTTSRSAAGAVQTMQVSSGQIQFACRFRCH
jgi:hypothetical protein